MRIANLSDAVRIGVGAFAGRVCFSPPVDALPPALGSEISCARSRASKSGSKPS